MSKKIVLKIDEMSCTGCAQSMEDTLNKALLDIDESMVTGDSVPVRKQVIKLVEEVQGTKVLIQDFAERITRIFVPIGTVTDIAIESGDIVLVKGDLVGVVKAIKLSKETFRKIRENLFWAFFYNIISIPMASLGFLHPIIAEITMAFSSINVITNSLRLRRIKL